MNAHVETVHRARRRTVVGLVLGLLMLCVPGVVLATIPGRGFLEICKTAAGPGVTGTFQFSVAGVTVPVPVGACSAPVEVPAGAVTITEEFQPGLVVAGISASPSARLVSRDLASRSVTVAVVEGDASTQTVVTFANTMEWGQLKVCKVAGPGVAVGTNFVFLAGGRAVNVLAGPAPGGFCTPAGHFLVGTGVTVAESVPSGAQVTGISVSPANRATGDPDLAAGRVGVAIGTGVTEVVFTNASAPTPTTTSTTVPGGGLPTTTTAPGGILPAATTTLPGGGILPATTTTLPGGGLPTTTTTPPGGVTTTTVPGGGPITTSTTLPGASPPSTVGGPGAPTPPAGGPPGAGRTTSVLAITGARALGLLPWATLAALAGVALVTMGRRPQGVAAFAGSASVTLSGNDPRTHRPRRRPRPQLPETRLPDTGPDLGPPETGPARPGLDVDATGEGSHDVADLDFDDLDFDDLERVLADLPSDVPAAPEATEAIAEPASDGGKALYGPLVRRLALVAGRGGTAEVTPRRWPASGARRARRRPAPWSAQLDPGR